MKLNPSLMGLYQLLLDTYGPQNWWPVDHLYHREHKTDPKDEIIIGAVLTQNTLWSRVEIALDRLKRMGELSLNFVRKCPSEILEEIVKPVGFYRQKVRTLKALAELLEKVREPNYEDLIKLKGIGPETACVILLYAFHQPTFVIDKYTLRILQRLYGLKLTPKKAKKFMEEHLPKDVGIYKEYHALLDQHAKKFCKSTPLCGGCPAATYCLSANPSF
ncbi:HhH-GPD family protein [Thermocrinis albus DSM 14484]|uniref:HhH-GPD family protein n=1 Tax=Thermocrinis albus (strain DSM 14484 / JCM 11386 / HI 11/12) TaxID=638303 RepID=D3SPB9_THEAH|nr:endonuclease [Thermocrinis albus]ADC89006.1 HhH-GPD family protein [Thermocrinis albus DSM 14484]